MSGWSMRSNSTSSGPGVAGYAYLASAHGQPSTGSFAKRPILGQSPKNNVVLIHEMGCLNLYHTFQGGCKNDDCLTDGDQVCDTPPDQVTFSACAYNSCGTDADDASANNPFTSDMADMTENYMDYSPF
ncbi:MAG: M43 family zinc metalloprotease [Saprospiraceae bacterium]